MLDNIKADMNLLCASFIFNFIRPSRQHETKMNRYFSENKPTQICLLVNEPWLGLIGKTVKKRSFITTDN